MPTTDLSKVNLQTMVTTTQRTDELRIYNGVLQRKFVNITKRGFIVTATIETWEDIPIVNGP